MDSGFTHDYLTKYTTVGKNLGVQVTEAQRLENLVSNSNIQLIED